MDLSRLEDNIFDDLVQDSHELWEWYSFVSYNHPELSKEDVQKRGTDLLTLWVNRGWLDAFESGIHKEALSGKALLLLVDTLQGQVLSPQKEVVVLSISVRALKDIGRHPVMDEGKTYINPNDQGQKVRTFSGFSTASDSIRKGPYAKISQNGEISYAALAGNPTLEKKPG